MEDNLRQRICHIINISILSHSLVENLCNDCFGEQIEGLSQVIDDWYERCNIHYAIKTLVDNIANKMPDDVEDQMGKLEALSSVGEIIQL